MIAAGLPVNGACAKACEAELVRGIVRCAGAKREADLHEWERVAFLDEHFDAVVERVLVLHRGLGCHLGRNHQHSKTKKEISAISGVDFHHWIVRCIWFGIYFANYIFNY
jgi:hypothetical protein